MLDTCNPEVDFAILVRLIDNMSGLLFMLLAQSVVCSIIDWLTCFIVEHFIVYLDTLAPLRIVGLRYRTACYKFVVEYICAVLFFIVV